ncbi:glycoside hydrolase [Pilobolus umbonatus]|nr:glycoside hydrolase [Pilobolus umbonatus]
MDRESERLSIEDIPWTQITHINYGFASMNEGVIPTLGDKGQLIKLVGLAHENNVKALLSIGGWLGSQSMSEMASTADNRNLFVKYVVDWVLEFGLDGVDIDWEYPGKGALECNKIDYANDSDNFLLLLRQLRVELDKAFNNGHKLLTIAVGTVPFFKNNAPMTDVSQYAEVLDWIFIMMYDTYVGKSVIGPNAPLQTSTLAGASGQSFSQSWVAWTSAHMPSDKIIMGLAFYGYASKSKEDAFNTKQLLLSGHGSRPQGDADDTLEVGPCPGSRHSYSGMWKWRSLKTTGILLDEYTPGGQWVKNWDQDSQTPWLYNPTTRQVISYDDPDSLRLKVGFAKCKEARGVGIWDLSFDYYTKRRGQLLTTINDKLYNSTELACNALVPILNYKKVGPQFNILSLQQVFASSTSHQSNVIHFCIYLGITISLFILY